MSTVHIACVCPPLPDGTARHPAGDDVTLRERLGFRETLSIRNTFVILNRTRKGTQLSEFLATLTEQYLLFGIEAWTLEDAEGKPVPIDPVTVRDCLLSHFDEAEAVGDAADDLYAEAVMVPLLRKASSSSPPTPTGPTSPTSPGSTTPSEPTPSSPSSITTTPTDDTETTSLVLAGVSSSSPNWTSDIWSEPSNGRMTPRSDGSGG